MSPRIQDMDADERTVAGVRVLFDAASRVAAEDAERQQATSTPRAA